MMFEWCRQMTRAAATKENVTSAGRSPYNQRTSSGNSMAIVIDPRLTIREAAMMPTKVNSRIGHASGVMISSAPAAVATPFPPANPMYGE